MVFLLLAVLLISALPFSRADDYRSDNGTTLLQTCLLDAKLAVVSASLSHPSMYYVASASDNLIFHYNPVAIVYPTSAAQVQRAVQCASKEPGLAVAARSGGHSFAGYGSGGMDGSLIIDLANMSTITVQRDGVEIQPAARLGDVIKQLWHHGKRAIPTGTCPSVGIGGLSLCGGVGPMSRLWGLTTDSIIEADLVLANGTLVTVRNNTDIMWALRGGGSFFGIVTRFVFATYDASMPVSYFRYQWIESLVTVDAAARLFIAIQAFALLNDLPNELGFHVQIKQASASSSKLAIVLHGTYLGPLSQYQQFKLKLLHELNTHAAPVPDLVEETQGTYLGLMEAWDDFGHAGDKLNTQAQRKIHNNFVTKSTLTLDHRKGFAAHAFRPVLQLLWDERLAHNETHNETNGKTAFWAWNVFFEFYGGSDPVHRRSEQRNASSLVNRDGLWLIQAAVGTLPDTILAQSGHAFASRLEAQILQAIAESGLERAGYSCYVDADLSEPDWKQLYYGPSLQRLEDLKMQLDPGNLFRNPQSLGDKQSIQQRRSRL